MVEFLYHVNKKGKLENKRVKIASKLLHKVQKDSLGRIERVFYELL